MFRVMVHTGKMGPLFLQSKDRFVSALQHLLIFFLPIVNISYITIP